MLEAIFYITIRAFIGWNIPQPWWSVLIQNKVVSYFKGYKK